MASIEIDCITAPPSCNFSVVKTLALGKESNSGSSQPDRFHSHITSFTAEVTSNQSKRKQGIAYVWPTSLKLYHCTCSHKHIQDYWDRNQLSQEQMTLPCPLYKATGERGGGNTGHSGWPPIPISHFTQPKGKCMMHATQPTFAKFTVTLLSSSLLRSVFVPRRVVSIQRYEWRYPFL